VFIENVQKPQASGFALLISYAVLYFLEVLLEALFLSVDPYMKYYLPPKILIFLCLTIFRSIFKVKAN
jgi:hypothetical protein